MVQNLPGLWQTWVQSLGWEDPLEDCMASHSSILAWRIPIDRGALRATVHGVAKSQTRLSDEAQNILQLLKYMVTRNFNDSGRYLGFHKF